MPKLCRASGCYYNVFGGGFCKIHQWKRQDKKAPKTIPQQSEKMKDNLKEYSRKKKKFLQENPKCQFPSCNKPSTEIHHKKGRGKYLSVVQYFMAVCHDHHEWIEMNRGEAYEKGYLLNRE